MTLEVLQKNAPTADRRIVSISSKRQITIPLKYFKLLGFGGEAECTIRGNELVISPVKPASNGEFAEEILADLIHQGLSGEELLSAFKAAQAKVRPAVEAMLQEAERAAKGEGEFYTMEDIENS